MGIPVSVLVQTKNEAIGIRACLASLQEFDEVIVVDSNSTDGTPQIARELGARVESFTWNKMYPKKKQWQLDNIETKHEWVLFLDADETPTPTFKNLLVDLPELSGSAGASAFDLDLLYVFDGKVLRHGHRVTKRALLRRSKASFPVMDDLDAPGMGELEGHYQPRVAGRVGHIKDALLHDDKDPVRTWFDRHNKYSDWETYLRTHAASRRNVASARSAQGRIFDHIPGKPLIFFFYAFVLKRGILDGRAGLNYALALSFYYWQIGVKVREARRQQSQRTI